MANLVLPSKYADAIFLIAKEKDILEKTKEELNIIKNVLEKNNDLKNIIFHPGISRAEKKKIIEGLFSVTISKFVINFLKLLIDKKRERLINDIVEIFSDRVDEYMGIKKVTVETAYPIETEEKERLINRLRKIMKSKVVLTTLTKKDMLGGIIIRDRLRLIDASVNQFLYSMRNRLLETRVSDYKKHTKRKTTIMKKKTKTKTKIKKGRMK